MLRLGFLWLLAGLGLLELLLLMLISFFTGLPLLEILFRLTETLLFLTTSVRALLSSSALCSFILLSRSLLLSTGVLIPRETGVVKPL